MDVSLTLPFHFVSQGGRRTKEEKNEYTVGERESHRCGGNTSATTTTISTSLYPTAAITLEKEKVS